MYLHAPVAPWELAISVAWVTGRVWNDEHATCILILYLAPASTVSYIARTTTHDLFVEALACTSHARCCFESRRFLHGLRKMFGAKPGSICLADIVFWSQAWCRLLRRTVAAWSALLCCSFRKPAMLLRFDLPIIGAMWSWQDIGAVPNARPWYTCFTNGVYQCLAWVLSSHLFRWMGWLDFTGLQDTCCMRPAHFYCHSFGVQRPDIPTPRFSTWNRLGEFQSVVEVQFVLVQVS